jgi:hypothetical protein
MKIIPNQDLIIKVWDENEQIDLRGTDGKPRPVKIGTPMEFHLKKNGAIDGGPTLGIVTYCENPDGHVFSICGEISFRMLNPVIKEMQNVIEELTIRKRRNECN